MNGFDMRPATENELSEMIRSAKEPLAIIGGGTRRIGPARGVALQTAGLSGVTLYEPGALTLVARAGTPLREIEALLAGERQRLSFEVPDLRGLLGRDGTSSIGGVVAANASGPRRVQSGACRDSLLGLRLVDGTGAIIKNGGRVMKNVTGYDLVKLGAGSRGTLGVLTEVSLRVQAQPETELTLICDCPAEAGLTALRSALGSPFDISGAAHADGKALIRLEGMAGSVAYRAEALRDRLAGEWQTIAEDESRRLWATIRDVRAFAGREGSVWRLVVKPSEAGKIAVSAGGEAIFDWGGGLVWLLTAGGQAAAIRAAVGTLGHATLMRAAPGDEGSAVFPTEAPAVARIAEALRAAFDPRGLFADKGRD